VSVAIEICFLGLTVRKQYPVMLVIVSCCSYGEGTMQEVLAPFVLDNLNCSGVETSILECPGAMGGMPTFGDPSFDGSVIIYNSNGGAPPGCDPFLASYAFVACGMTDGPGRLCLVRTLVHTIAWTCISLHRRKLHLRC